MNKLIENNYNDLSLEDFLKLGRFVVDEKNKIIYKWSPKCGCTLLMQMCLWTNHQNEFKKFSETQSNIFHATAGFYWKYCFDPKLNINDMKNYRKIFVVRDPVDRFESAYNHIVYRNAKLHEKYSPETILKTIKEADYKEIKYRSFEGGVLYHFNSQRYPEDFKKFEIVDLKSEKFKKLMKQLYGNYFLKIQEEFVRIGHHNNSDKILVNIKGNSMLSNLIIEFDNMELLYKIAKG